MWLLSPQGSVPRSHVPPSGPPILTLSLHGRDLGSLLPFGLILGLIRTTPPLDLSLKAGPHYYFLTKATWFWGLPSSTGRSSWSQSPKLSSVSISQ